MPESDPFVDMHIGFYYENREGEIVYIYRVEEDVHGGLLFFDDKENFYKENGFAVTPKTDLIRQLKDDEVREHMEALDRQEAEAKVHDKKINTIVVIGCALMVGAMFGYIVGKNS